MKPLVSVDELRKLMPRLSPAAAKEYAPLLSEAMLEFEIVSKKRRCAFLSTLCEESMQLTRWVENMSYSAKRLTEVWPRRFPTIESARPFAGDSRSLAEKVYGGRMGNTAPGDGFKYRGRFPIQATGRSMYRKLSRALDQPLLESDPDACLSDKLLGFRVSAWIFAVEKGCNGSADKLRMDGSAHDRSILTEICERINGGHTGLSERINYFRIAKQILHNGENQDLPSPQAPVAPPAVRPVDDELEQSSVDSQVASPGKTTGHSEATPTEPESDLLGTAVHSEKAKQFGARFFAKHGGALLTWLGVMYELHKWGLIVVGGLIFVAIVWVLYHNRKKLAPHIQKLLK